MKKITDSELLELPFGSKIKVIWPDSIYCNKRAGYYGIVFGNNIGYEGGSIDDLRTIAKYMFDNWCMVYQINE